MQGQRETPNSTPRGVLFIVIVKTLKTIFFFHLLCHKLQCTYPYVEEQMHSYLLQEICNALAYGYVIYILSLHLIRDPRIYTVNSRYLDFGYLE